MRPLIRRAVIPPMAFSAALGVMAAQTRPPDQPPAPVPGRRLILSPNRRIAVQADERFGSVAAIAASLENPDRFVRREAANALAQDCWAWSSTATLTRPKRRSETGSFRKETMRSPVARCCGPSASCRMTSRRRSRSRDSSCNGRCRSPRCARSCNWAAAEGLEALIRHNSSREIEGPTRQRFATSLFHEPARSPGRAAASGAASASICKRDR